MKLMIRSLFVSWAIFATLLHTTLLTAAVVAPATLNSDAITVSAPQPLLFTQFPGLSDLVGWVSLGALPTPVKQLTNVGASIGNANIWIKDDGQTAAAGLFGGNKLRKLEFLLGDALKNGYKDVITWGYAGSNHTCTTAVHARRVGLGCRIHHGHQVPTKYAQRNLARSYKEQATLAIYETFAEAMSDVDAQDAAYKATNPQGHYRIHSGGSNPVGTLGFVEAALELKQQVDAGLMPEPDVIYVGMGSCATAAGLALGAKLAGLKSEIVAVLVEPDEPIGNQATGFYRAKTDRLFREAAAILATVDPSLQPLTEMERVCTLNYDFSHAGYGVTLPPSAAAIQLMFDQEQIKLDGTYSGKAFAAALEAAQKPLLQDKVILFWNTFFPGDAGVDCEEFDYTVLPAGYARYFTTPLQPLDLGF